MIASFLLSLVVNPLWSKPIDTACTLSASHNGKTVLTSCRSQEALALTLVTSDGRSLPVEDVDAVMRDAVPTASPLWSPSDEFVVMEVALDEEPGVLLIEVSDTPNARLFDRSLTRMQLSATGPQWHSGEWLVFHTSGTGGDLAMEGVYALRLKDRVLFRLLSLNATRIAVTHTTLYVSHMPISPGGKRALSAFPMRVLLEKATRVAPGDAATVPATTTSSPGRRAICSHGRGIRR